MEACGQCCAYRMVVLEQVRSADNHPGEQQSQAQTHAPAPGSGLLTDTHTLLNILQRGIERGGRARQVERERKQRSGKKQIVY